MASEEKISDDAVRARTGKRWAQWLAILDRWGAAEKGHRATARWLLDERGLSPWWAQTVTIRHELERGLRRKHGKSGGFEVSVSRVIAAPATRVFDAFSRPAALSRWFTRGARARLAVGGSYSNHDGDRGRFLALAPPKRLRMTWENPRHAPGTVVEFTTARSASGKTTARVVHGGLATARDAKTLKEAWSWALDSLRAYVETGTPITVEAWERDRRAKRRRAAAKRPAAQRAPARRAGPQRTARTRTKKAAGRTKPRRR